MAAKKLATVTLKGNVYYPVNTPAGFDGKPRRSKTYCTSRNQAIDLKARIKHWKLTRKFRPDTVEITGTDKGWLAFLKNEIGHDLSDLPRIVQHWKDTGKAISARVTVRHAVDEFLKYREGKVVAKTLSDDRYRLRRFKAQFGDWQLAELIPANFREFLDGSEDQTSQRNDYKILSPWVKWCIEQRWVIVNPMAEIKRPKVKSGEPEVYPIESFRKLLSHSDTETRAFIALGGLAGLRTSEMLKEREADKVIQWTDIDFANKRITVRPEVSKTDRKRYTPMCDALVSWLDPLRKESGPVVPLSQSAFRKHEAALFTAAEVAPVDNGLRHSFASYWLATHGGEKGVGALAVIMGNSEAVAKRHYISILTPETGLAWFGVARV
jgi:integrase